MRRFGLGLLVLSAACDKGEPVRFDAALDAYVVPVDTLDICAGGGRDKLKFTRPESCSNDGSVEWCIPDNDAQLQATITAISPTIRCAGGGGRAGCYMPAGRLLCSYPTGFPGQCLTSHGEMKPEVWDDMCELAALPQVTEIVPTFNE